MLGRRWTSIDQLLSFNTNLPTLSQQRRANWVDLDLDLDLQPMDLDLDLDLTISESEYLDLDLDLDLEEEDSDLDLPPWDSTTSLGAVLLQW